MNEGEQKKYYQMFVDCWRLFLKYRDPGKSHNKDLFWQNFGTDAHRIYDRYQGSEPAKGLLLAVYKRLGQIEDGAMKQGG